jgi:hypothetical protein
MPNPWPKDWIKAGGLLGLAVLAARTTRTPLASLLTAMPLLLKSFQDAQAGQARQQPAGSMSREEALLILGLREGAGPQDIQDAHRRLIQKNHPDAGGSDYLAAQINRARDVLLK